MKPDDIQLLAYVDGTLPAHARREVEREIRASPDAADRVARLKASRLPYAHAFASRSLPPMPARIAARIKDMARIFQANGGFPQTSVSGTSRQTGPKRRNRRE